MSGVRQTRGITCSHCGTQGVVELGMGTIGALDETRDFSCPTCSNNVSVQAPRAILDVKWQAMVRPGSAHGHGVAPI